MLINKNIIFVVLVILFFIFFIPRLKDTFENIKASNSFLNDIIVQDLSVSELTKDIPLGFKSFEKNFQIPINDQYILLDFISNKINLPKENISFYSLPYFIHFSKLQENQFNFIFFIDIQNKQTFKINSLQVLMSSSNEITPLENIQFISLKEINIPKLELKEYHPDMNIYKIQNELGIF
jgi:hypothetical protein